jgi:hypothetical protein
LRPGPMVGQLFSTPVAKMKFGALGERCISDLIAVHPAWWRGPELRGAGVCRHELKKRQYSGSVESWGAAGILVG